MKILVLLIWANAWLSPDVASNPYPEKKSAEAEGVVENCGAYRFILFGFDESASSVVSRDLLLLEHAFKSAFPGSVVERFSNAEASQNRLRAIIEYIGAANSSTCILFYYAGEVINTEISGAYHGGQFVSRLSWHGMPPGGQGLSFRVVEEAMHASNAAAVLMAVDQLVAASRAEYVVKSTGDEAARFIFSTSKKKRAEIQVLGETHSVFAASLADALANQTADTNENGVQLWGELNGTLRHILPRASAAEIFLSDRTYTPNPAPITFSPAATAERVMDRDVFSEHYENMDNVSPPTARVSFVSDPPGASVFVDGWSLGPTPITDNIVTSGEKTIEVKAGDYLLWKQNAFIQDGVAIEAKLQKAYNYVLIKDIPTDAVFVVGDTVQMSLVGDSLRLPVGRHEALMRYDAGLSLPVTFTVLPDQRASYRFKKDAFDFVQPLKSAFLPGRGQYLDGARGKSYTFLAAAIASGGMLLGSHLAYKRTLNEYDDLYAQYLFEPLEAEALRLWDEASDTFERADKLNGVRTISTIALAGIYTINVLDAFIFHARKDRFEKDESRVSLALLPNPGGKSSGIMLALKLN